MDFFPPCAVSDKPARRRASGFRELGLPFESDTAITRHLAAFLTAQGDAKTGPIRPTHILFNGGVFKADMLRERLLEVVGSWFGAKAAPRALEGNRDLDLAVARGAAYYGLAKQGRGVRIRGGAARSYYVGIETAGLAIPGAVRPLRALCVVPFGMEEGTELDVPGERDRRGRRRAGVLSLLQLRDPQARQAGRPDRVVDRRRNLRNRFARSDASAGRRPGRRSMCRSAFIRTSRNLACSSCGASARFPTTAGSWNSASATTLASRLTTLARSVSEEVGRWSCSSVLANASG